MGGGGFFNPAGVLSFSKSLSCFQLCPSSCAGVAGLSAHPSHPVFLLPPPALSCRCLGEDALRAIRPPPREACLSLSAFLSVLQAKDALEARAHSPSLHSEPAAAICQLLLFPKKEKITRDRPRSERQRTPKTSGPGERVEHRRRQNHPQPPRPLCSPFLHFRMGLRMRRCRRGPLPGTGRLEMEPKGTGGPRTPGCCLRGAAGEPRHRWRLGTRSWHHLRCCWQPGPAH